MKINFHTALHRLSVEIRLAKNNVTPSFVLLVSTKTMFGYP